MYASAGLIVLLPQWDHSSHRSDPTITSQLTQPNSQHPHSGQQVPTQSVRTHSPLLPFLILSGHNGLPIILPTSQSQSAWGSLQLLSPSPRNTHIQISAWSSSHFLQIFIPKPPSQEHLPCLPCLNLHNSPQHFQPLASFMFP